MQWVSQCARFGLVTSSTVFAYLASAILIVWGSAHLVPTLAVAASFGEISADNRRILMMEWIAEGITHIWIGILVILATALEGVDDATVELVCVVAAGVLVVLALLTLFTGARTGVAWFRVCPVVLTSVAVLLVLAAVG